MVTTTAMKRLIGKIGAFYGVVIMLAAILIATTVNTSLINYNAQLSAENQEQILGVLDSTGRVLNGTHKLINLEGNFSVAQARTDKQIILSIADSLRNTNNQTTQLFFNIGKTNGKLISDNNELLKQILGNVTKLLTLREQEQKANRTK